MINFTETNTTDLLGLCLRMYSANLTEANAFEMLKVSLPCYTIDTIELELYAFKMQCRNGLSHDAVIWADNLIDIWTNQ